MVAERGWSNVATRDATLAIVSDRSVQADGTRFQQLLENLFRNAVEHGGETVTVTVGELPGGFYVEDDGSGIAPEDVGSVLESGFTTSTDGLRPRHRQGNRRAHGWEITVTSGAEVVHASNSRPFRSRLRRQAGRLSAPFYRRYRKLFAS